MPSRLQVVTGHICTDRSAVLEAEATANVLNVPLPRSWQSAGKASKPPSYSPVLATSIDKNGAVYQRRRTHNLGFIEEIHRRFDVIKFGGGGKSVETHYKRGKMLARDRIRAVIDEGTDFMELNTFAMWNMFGGGWHSGGFVTAIGIVGGKECVFLANDATIKGGTGGAGLWRAQEISKENCLPAIYLMDGGGAKLDAQAGGGKGKRDGPERDLSYEGALPAAFMAGGRGFFMQCRLQALGIPQVAVTLGGATAGAAYFVALCQENVIVQGNGKVYLGGPPLVKAATGEDADDETLGGAKMHTTISGTVDHYAADEPTALQKCRQVVEHVGARPRTVLPNMAEPELPLYDPEELLGIVPESNDEAFDIREVIARVVDGSRFHEFKADYGSSLVCGFAHVEGFPVGLLGNNGLLTSRAMIKASQFIQLCGARTCPLVFLHNVKGFEVGEEAELGAETNGGVVKASALMMTAMSTVPVPKFSIIVGDSIGPGNYVMCGKAFEPRFTFVWPNARVAPMTPEEGGATAVFEEQRARRETGEPALSAGEAEALGGSVMGRLREASSAWHCTAGCYDDGLIDPRETRRYLSNCISISLNAPIQKENYGIFRT